MIMPPFVRWAIINANWTAVNRDACPADGACWGIIPNRFHQYMFGLYPVDQYWRLITGGILLLVGCIPLALPQMPRKALYGICFAIIYPIIANSAVSRWLAGPARGRHAAVGRPVPHPADRHRRHRGLLPDRHRAGAGAAIDDAGGQDAVRVVHRAHTRRAAGHRAVHGLGDAAAVLPARLHHRQDHARPHRRVASSPAPTWPR